MARDHLKAKHAYRDILRTKSDFVQYFSDCSKIKTVELKLEGILRRNDISLPMRTLEVALEAAKEEDETLVCTLIKVAIKKAESINQRLYGEYAFTPEQRNLMGQL